MWEVGAYEKRRKQGLFQLKSCVLVNLFRVDADSFREFWCEAA
jgi:hypothetical protein